MSIADERLGPVRDLGAFDGSVLALGGPLGNLEALRRAIEESRRLGIPAARVICTGDVAGYFADSEACARLLMEAGIATVMGNVDEALAADAADCGCGFVAGSVCEALAGAWYGHARATVGRETREWMTALPRRLAFTLNGARVAVVHGGARRINRYLFASDEGALAEEVTALGADAVIAGHAGLPFTRVVGDAVWHNPGALGLPANDGTPRVWCSVIAPRNDGLEFRHVPILYLEVWKFA